MLLLLTVPGYTAQFFVAVNGNDLNSGSIEQPFKTIAKALTVTSALQNPGDTIFIRGGVYAVETPIVIKLIGAADALYQILAFPGEKVVLDFSAMSYSSKNRGIILKGNFCRIQGLDIKGAGDCGMHITGSHNVIENCAFYENRDSGVQLDGGASFNTIVNCDAYYNADPDNFGDADGFACKMDVGTGNYFYGCRAWGNVDDGWDGYLRGTDTVSTTLENCWAFGNGYFKNQTDGGEHANGNGFKMGGSDSKLLKHDFTLKNCLAFMNKSHGFDQNSNKGNMFIVNCTAAANGGRNYFISKPVAEDRKAAIKNSISFNGKNSIAKHVEQQTNSWQLGNVISDSDFVCTDTTGYAGAAMPRKADGCLPDIHFMHLSPCSRLIAAGTGTTAGISVDLGCFTSQKESRKKN